MQVCCFCLFTDAKKRLQYFTEDIIQLIASTPFKYIRQFIIVEPYNAYIGISSSVADTRLAMTPVRILNG